MEEINAILFALRFYIFNINTCNCFVLPFETAISGEEGF
jgi:hypothetical protein